MFLTLALMACGGDVDAPPPPGGTDPTDDTGTPATGLDTGETGSTTDTEPTGETVDTQDTVDTEPTEPAPCAWPGSDPGTLGPETGNQPGDTFTDLPVTAQCGNDLSLWDLAGEYHLPYFTGAW